MITSWSEAERVLRGRTVPSLSAGWHCEVETEDGPVWRLAVRQVGWVDLTVGRVCGHAVWLTRQDADHTSRMIGHFAVLMEAVKMAESVLEAEAANRALDAEIATQKALSLPSRYAEIARPVTLKTLPGRQPCGLGGAWLPSLGSPDGPSFSLVEPHVGRVDLTVRQGVGDVLLSVTPFGQTAPTAVQKVDKLMAAVEMAESVLKAERTLRRGEWTPQPGEVAWIERIGAGGQSGGRTFAQQVRNVLDRLTGWQLPGTDRLVLDTPVGRAEIDLRPSTDGWFNGAFVWADSQAGLNVSVARPTLMEVATALESTAGSRQPASTAAAFERPVEAPVTDGNMDDLKGLKRLAGGRQEKTMKDFLDFMVSEAHLLPDGLDPADRASLSGEDLTRVDQALQRAGEAIVKRADRARRWEEAFDRQWVNETTGASYAVTTPKPVGRLPVRTDVPIGPRIDGQPDDLKRLAGPPVTERELAVVEELRAAIRQRDERVAALEREVKILRAGQVAGAEAAARLEIGMTRLRQRLDRCRAELGDAAWRRLFG